MRWELTVHAEFSQFIMEDPAGERAVSEGQHEAEGLLTGYGILAVQTAGWGDKPVVVEVLDEPPADDLAAWDHVVEASIDLPSGRIAVHGLEDYDAAPQITVPPGSYGVRIYSGNLASVLEARPNGELVIKPVGGDDYYRLVLWPAPSQPTRLLKRHTIDQLRT